MTPTPPGDIRPEHYRDKPRRIAGAVFIGVGVLLIIIGTVTIVRSGNGGSPSPAVTVFRTAPPVTITQTVTPSATPGQVLLKHNGTGIWVSPPFLVSSSAPQLTVTYTFSGNLIGGQPDNFAADISSADDTQRFANTIAASGGGTTTVYPDTTSGDATYHLDVMASGSWTVTITEIS